MSPSAATEQSLGAFEMNATVYSFGSLLLRDVQHALKSSLLELVCVNHRHGRIRGEVIPSVTSSSFVIRSTSYVLDRLL